MFTRESYLQISLKILQTDPLLWIQEYKMHYMLTNGSEDTVDLLVSNKC